MGFGLLTDDADAGKETKQMELASDVAAVAARPS
jgi:hypothetical protein